VKGDFVALCSADVDENLKLLVNGEEVAVFSQNVINLKVKKETLFPWTEALQKKRKLQ